LNRLFHNDAHPTAAAVRRLAEGHQFEAAMMLHEDYDALGVYLYEHCKDQPLGELILEAAELVIPRETRTRVDGRKAKNGVLKPRILLKKFEAMGHPEAVWLHLKGSRRSVTFETPSEWALESRVRAQMAAIERLVQLVGKSGV
jgi:hypothetical protein